MKPFTRPDLVQNPKHHSRLKLAFYFAISTVCVQLVNAQTVQTSPANQVSKQASAGPLSTSSGWLSQWKSGSVANPVFQGAGNNHWDAKIRERGWIVRNGDQWHLYYTGYNPSKSAPTDLRRLGLATSADGLHWIRQGDAPLVSDLWVEDMSITRHGGKWIMVAEGRDDIAHSLVSDDGLKWLSEGPLDIRSSNGQPISAGPRGTPFLMYEKSQWFLFYERGDAGVWLATSRDRKIWTNIQDEPVISLGPGKYDQGGIALNQVVKIDGQYLAVLHANEKRPFNSYWTTTFALSNDLIHWKKYDGNPVLANNSSSGQLIRLKNGTWRLYTMHPEVRVFESVDRPAAVDRQ